VFEETHSAILDSFLVLLLGGANNGVERWMAHACNTVEPGRPLKKHLSTNTESSQLFPVPALSGV